MFDALFSLDFWFQNPPPPLTPFFERGLFAFFGIMLIVGAIVRIMASYKKEDKLVLEIFNRAGSLLVTMGGLGLVLYLFSYERIPFLGIRMWFIVWGIGLLAWVGTSVFYACKTVPCLRRQAVAKEERMKYFPRGKKKKSKKRR